MGDQAGQRVDVAMQHGIQLLPNVRKAIARLGAFLFEKVSQSEAFRRTAVADSVPVALAGGLAGSRRGDV